MWIDKSINLSVCDDIDCEQSLIFYGDSGLSCVSRVSRERRAAKPWKHEEPGREPFTRSQHSNIEEIETFHRLF